MFVSVGVDGTLSLRSTLRKMPLMSTIGSVDRADRNAPMGLYCADWSKVRPSVFAVAGDGGTVQIHDLGTDQPMMPVAQLEMPPVHDMRSTRSRALAL